jgi:hypothetical protein
MTATYGTAYFEQVSVPLSSLHPNFNYSDAMLSSKIIALKADNEEFARVYTCEARGHKPVDITYLMPAFVRVFFNPQRPEVWLAGYVINTQAPFRYFIVLDAAHKAALLAQHGISENDLSEVTCIWIKRDKIAMTERLQVYFTSMVDAFRIGKAHIFGGSTEAKVVGLQKQIMPHDFANGTALVGDEFTNYWIYYVGRWESVFTMLRFVTKQFIGGFFKKKAQPKVPVLPTEPQKGELVA